MPGLMSKSEWHPRHCFSINWLRTSVKRRPLAAFLATKPISSVICASDLASQGGASTVPGGATSIRKIDWFLSSTTQMAPSAAAVIPTGAPCGRTPFTLYQPDISS